ncbi:sensor histidine kinase [Shumkonia mesophila]|uniref:sensor histidine kinase n=1 Tax=Shumkonia mesophila TaxID=2838854 RepID=UPI002934494E|nr:ABC transporter substrate binding protein [Shumkonia mesophila]
MGFAPPLRISGRQGSNGGGGYRRRWSFLAAAGVLATALAFATAPALAAKKRVLVINSYNVGNAQTDNIIGGIRSVFASEMPGTELFFEQLDSLRHPATTVYPHMEALVRSKYAGTGIDVIVVANDAALDFLLTRRSRLFPNVPIVFCGVHFRNARIAGESNITGVAEDVDMRRTIELALKLHSHTELVMAISDFSMVGRYDFERFWQIFPDFEDVVSFDELIGPSESELIGALKRMPSKTVILDIAFLKDRRGKFFTPTEAMALYAKHSPFPVYTLWDYYVGAGTVGGIVVSGRHQGETAASMAVRILKGEPASTIPVLRDSPNVPMFDFLQLQRFRIPVSALPEGSIVINRPENFYWKYKYAIWAVAGFTASLMVLVVLLSANILQRRKAVHALTDSESRYRAIVEDQTEFVVRFTPDFRLSFANHAFLNFVRINGFVRLDEAELVGSNLRQLVPERRMAEIEAHLGALTPDQPIFEDEQAIRLNHRETRWIKWTVRAIYNAHDTLTEFQVVGADITDQKETQNALSVSREQFRRLAMLQQEALEDDRARISREIHDELGQNLTALKMGLSMLRRVIPSIGRAAADRLSALNRMIEETIRSVQRISQELRPTQLDDFGLIAAMEWHASEFLAGSGLRVDFEHGPGDQDGLDREQATAVYRIYQEALTNVVRHARASAIHIRLERERNRFVMEIEDDGIGIPQQAVDCPSSFGLIGMRERARSLGGTMTLSRAPHRGTRICVEIPFREAEVKATGKEATA